VSINIELTAQEIDALKQATKIENDVEAIAKAAREFLRLNSLRELKAVSGKVELQENGPNPDELELGESAFPR
jgi:hypothetical protein